MTEPGVSVDESLSEKDSILGNGSVRQRSDPSGDVSNQLGEKEEGEEVLTIAVDENGRERDIEAEMVDVIETVNHKYPVKAGRLTEDEKNVSVVIEKSTVEVADSDNSTTTGLPRAQQDTTIPAKYAQKAGPGKDLTENGDTHLQQKRIEAGGAPQDIKKKLVDSENIRRNSFVVYTDKEQHSNNIPSNEGNVNDPEILPSHAPSNGFSNKTVDEWGTEYEIEKQEINQNNNVAAKQVKDNIVAMEPSDVHTFVEEDVVDTVHHGEPHADSEFDSNNLDSPTTMLTKALDAKSIATPLPKPNIGDSPVSSSASTLKDDVTISRAGRAQSLTSINAQHSDRKKDASEETRNRVIDDNLGITIFEQKRRQRKRLHLQKWRRMMAQWEHFEQKYPSKIRQRIRRGIPNILRGHMWMSLTGAGVAKYHNANVYQECLYAPNSGLEETISRDISRTFPKAPTIQSYGRVRPTLIVSSVACLQCLQPSGGVLPRYGLYVRVAALLFKRGGCFLDNGICYAETSNGRFVPGGPSKITVVPYCP